ncbi:molybdate ABC transporter substrate-binding protein [Ancylobacter sp. 6x-1]|uniref:Molybdate ABC transporter substrate-binding protein n=1 Tax=Ancylobacter crimeensis TaxID=2579147 RepID=A0ABT0D870_9HYPH|nr:molybdate ABC transporter substrate-binding protein [Ancylobacter crimeensis]MCK0196119.1 molybdate ABC transporter substrate-binding protein [Ancylobacter crimeensis]
MSLSRAFAAFLVFLASLTGTARAQAPVTSTQTVFAAASMSDALRKVNDAWVAHGNASLQFNFAASSTLIRQIDQSAKAAVFISADERWADWGIERGLLVKSSRVSPIGNRLVLIAPNNSSLTRLDLTKTTDLVALLGRNGRLATGDPAHVPVGRYAEQALTWMNQWTAINPRLARADSVRSAMLLVERGEAPLGIVYETDAAVSTRVKIVGIFPKESHEAVTYPFVLVKAQDSPDARAVLAFLIGPEALEIYRSFGFTTP